MFKSVRCLIVCILVAATAVGSAQDKINSDEQHLSSGLTRSNPTLFNTDRPFFTWKAPLILGIASSGAFLAQHYWDQKVDHSGIDGAMGFSASLMSDVGNYLPFALPAGFFLSSFVFNNRPEVSKKSRRVAIELAESLALTYGTTELVKRATERTRPSGSDQLSFPSGHTSLIFSTATVLAYEYPWYVGALSYTFASAVGVTRLDLNKHFLSDVVAGAGLGILVGSGSVYFNKYMLSRKRVPSDPGKGVFPLAGNDTYGLGYKSNF